MIGAIAFLFGIAFRDRFSWFDVAIGFAVVRFAQGGMWLHAIGVLALGAAISVICGAIDMVLFAARRGAP